MISYCVCSCFLIYFNKNSIQNSPEIKATNVPITKMLKLLLIILSVLLLINCNITAPNTMGADK